MGYIIKSTITPTLYFTGTIMKTSDTPIFNSDITKARVYESLTYAQDIKKLIVTATEIIES